MMDSKGLGGRRDPHAFPYRQLFVLGLCRICEPIAFMSIFPYIYYMIESFQITTDYNRIAFFAGMVTSIFAAAECVGAGFWGHMSDRFGRKPILLCGIAGTGVSMLIFGFAPNLPVALLARALGGALNGNIGVLQTTVTEVIKVETHQARAYAIMPTVWCVGAILGSALGGALADPVRNYPAFFAPDTIFARFPYLLTNLVCSGMVVFSLAVGFLFLEETHEDKKHARDVGLELGAWLVRRGTAEPALLAAASRRLGKGGMEDETHQLVVYDDDLPEYSRTAAAPELCDETVADLLPPPAYRSHEGSPRCSLTAGDSLLTLEDGHFHPAGVALAPHAPTAFSRQVMFNIAGFGILAYHTISAEQLLPVLLSMPKAAAPPSLPFGFTGGFALPTKTIGAILSVQGIMQMLATIVVFPVVNRRIGSLWTYRCAVLLYPLLYFLVPYITLLPDAWKLPAVYAVLAWKVTGQAFAYPSSSIMLANAAPSTKVLGTLNGAAASAASASRALGPTLSGLLQAAGLSIGTLGLPWWTNVVVALAGAVISLLMVEEKRRTFGGDPPSTLPPVADVPRAVDIPATTPAADEMRLTTDPCAPLLRPRSSSLDLLDGHDLSSLHLIG